MAPVLAHAHVVASAGQPPSEALPDPPLMDPWLVLIGALALVGVLVAVTR
jgi:hypothetical protein